MAMPDAKRKVLICIPCLGLGGAEDIIVRLANGLSREYAVSLRVLLRCDEDRSRVAALAPEVDFRSAIGGARSQNSLSFKLWNLVFYILSPFWAVYLLFLFKVREHQVVHLNLTQFALLSAFWRWMLPGRRPAFVQTFHTNMHLLRPWQRRIFTTSWPLMDKVVVEIDEREINNVLNHTSKDRITFIPFAVAMDDAEIARRDKHRSERVTLGSLARLRLFEKKYDQILQALALLKDQGFQFRYLIGGDGHDRATIEKLVLTLGLQDHVKLLGVIEDRAAFFAQLDLMIVATVGYETGIAGLQALAAGVPIIGFNTKSSFASEPARPLVVACHAEQLCADLRILCSGDLRAYWADLCVERASQLGDSHMVESYSTLFASMSGGRSRPDSGVQSFDR